MHIPNGDTALLELIRFDDALAAALALGYAAESPPSRPRKPLEELVEWRE